MELITSPQNPRVKLALKLRDAKGRAAQGRIIIDGCREVNRALVAGVRTGRGVRLPGTGQPPRAARARAFARRAKRPARLGLPARCSSGWRSAIGPKG